MVFESIFDEIIVGVFNTILLTQISLVLTAILALIAFPFISKRFIKIDLQEYFHISF